MRSSVLLVAMLLGLPSTAFGQWIYTGQKSDFGGSGKHLAIGTSGLYAIGFRCDQPEPILLFLTPEQVTSDEASNFAVLGTELLIKVDEHEAFELVARAGSVDGQLALSSAAPADLAVQVKTARQRVSVAIRMMGQLFHETRITASGSTKAMTSFLKACPALAGEIDS